MDHLCGLAVGVAFAGRAYHHVHAHLLRNNYRLHRCTLVRCHVFKGFRTRARGLLSRRWVRGPHGFVRMADPLHTGPYTYYGWQAPPVRGGGCGGHLYAFGLPGNLRLKLRLRRTRTLLPHLPVQVYIKCGTLARCGARGTRLVRPTRWSPVPPEALHITTTVSRDGRFLNVDIRWV